MLRFVTIGLMFLLAAPQPAPQKSPPRQGLTLLRLIGPENKIAEALPAGTKEKPVVFFRDNEGNRLKVERTGDSDHGFVRRYNFVGSEGGYVEIRDFYVFHKQGLQLDPMIVTINGKSIAGYIDIGSGVEAKRFGKKVYAAYTALPQNFQRVLYNYCAFGQTVDYLDIDASMVGVLLSENWVDPSGLPDYDVQVVPVTDDENAVPNFQRAFLN